MELTNKEPAEIWRMLIPRRHWLYADELEDDEFIFAYRNHVYFVNDDGSVLSVAQPDYLELCDIEDLYDLLEDTQDTFDFDDNGIFDYGSILKRMGYIASTGSRGERAGYMIEIVNTIDPDAMLHRYELDDVSMTYALYHALLRCHELNAKSDWEFEHEVKQIVKIEKYAEPDLQRKH